MTRVMIAIDGSDLDVRLAEAAHDLFGEDAEYWAVNVHTAPVTPPAGTLAPVPGMYAGFGAAYPFPPRRPDQIADASLGDDGPAAPGGEDAARAAARSAGIEDAAVIAETGDPPTAILTAADRHRADVIVVGSRDRGWWSRLVEPSVSGDVIEGSRRPVLVIPERS